MTIIPPGARLAPVDLPPPPPSADPREPEATRRCRTPVRAKSPYSSRASSPVRTSSTSPPPLLAPKPHTASTLTSGAPVTPTTSSSLTAAAAMSSTGKPTHHGHHFPHGHLSRPSSPSSIHSSGSAIFERDIEMPAVASLSLNPSGPTLSHKSSRIFHQPHGSNLEHTVPAVLDDAIEALTADAPLTGLEIEAPVASSVGAARSPSSNLSPALRARVTSFPSASGASRSPSPDALGGPGGSGSPISAPLSLATALASSPDRDTRSPVSPLSMGSAISPVETLAPLSPTSPSAGSKHRPAPLRQLSSGPQLPGGWAFDEDSQGATAVKLDDAPALAIPSHMTPTKDSKRRVSFISYNDLLLSVPTTVTSLNEITSGNLSPDHLPGTVSPTVPVTRSPALAASATIPSTLSALAPLEGEWSREGLGRGLEQRLEALIPPGENQTKA